MEAKGGHKEAEKRLTDFLRNTLSRYHLDRNHPDAKATSNLSAYLHFGHLSVHQIFAELTKFEQWRSVSAKASGKREGWWGMSPGGEAFLDQLVTWRELGFNMCSRRADYDRFDFSPTGPSRPSRPGKTTPVPIFIL